MSVSVCMIVRDEEENIPQAVASTIGLGDEIILVDTGSSDDTVNLARKLGCTVITGADKMHKANARNKAIDIASGDWVITLDADERIVEPGEWRQSIEQDTASALYVKLDTYRDGKIIYTNRQIRTWKRDRLRYKYRAHEIPVPVNGNAKARMTDLLVNHYPTKRDSPDRIQYTMDRLVLDVQENPNDPRPVFYLGRQHFYAGDYDESARLLRQYISMGGGADIADAWLVLSQSYGKLDNGRGQIAALHQACAVEPHRRLYWGELARAYWFAGRKSQAIGIMQMVLTLPKTPVARAQHGWFSERPHRVLAQWLREVGNSDAAMEQETLASQIRVKKTNHT